MSIDATCIFNSVSVCIVVLSQAGSTPPHWRQALSARHCQPTSNASVSCDLHATHYNWEMEYQQQQ